GQRGLHRLGKKAWRRAVHTLVPLLMDAFLADYVVLGDGNARHLKRLPSGTRLGHNQPAFRGGVPPCPPEGLLTLAAPAGPRAPTCRWGGLAACWKPTW